MVLVILIAHPTQIVMDQAMGLEMDQDQVTLMGQVTLVMAQDKETEMVLDTV